MKRLILFISVTVAAGCATRNETYAPAMTHPANPSAPVAARHLRSRSVPLGQEDTHLAPETKSDGDSNATSSHAPIRKEVTYVCPMHPEVVSTDPNARCPKCGMALEQRERSQKEDHR